MNFEKITYSVDDIALLYTENNWNVILQVSEKGINKI